MLRLEAQYSLSQQPIGISIRSICVIHYVNTMQIKNHKSKQTVYDVCLIILSLIILRVFFLNHSLYFWNVTLLYFNKFLAVKNKHNVV